MKKIIVEEKDFNKLLVRHKAVLRKTPTYGVQYESQTEKAVLLYHSKSGFVGTTLELAN